MKKAFILLIINVFCVNSYAQDTIKKREKNEETGYYTWTKPRTALRFGVGLQKSIYTELGVSKHKYMITDVGFAAISYYSSMEFTPTFHPDYEKNIYGFKVGYEINSVIAFGIETKYQTDFNFNNFVVTPKIGIGVIGVINIYYAYNFSINENPFSKIGNNQISIVFNLNKHNLKDLWHK